MNKPDRLYRLFDLNWMLHAIVLRAFLDAQQMFHPRWSVFDVFSQMNRLNGRSNLCKNFFQMCDSELKLKFHSIEILFPFLQSQCTHSHNGMRPTHRWNSMMRRITIRCALYTLYTRFTLSGRPELCLYTHQNCWFIIPSATDSKLMSSLFINVRRIWLDRR